MLLLPEGQQVPLRSVVTWEEGRSWARIARFNRQRAATLIGDIDTSRANTSELVRLFKAKFLPELRARHSDLSITIDGEPKEAGKARIAMLAALGLGMLCIFFLLTL